MTDGTPEVKSPPNPEPCDVCGEPASWCEPGGWGGDLYLCSKHMVP